MATIRQHLDLQDNKLFVMWATRVFDRDLHDGQSDKLMEMQFFIGRLTGEIERNGQDFRGPAEDYALSHDELVRKYTS